MAPNVTCCLCLDIFCAKMVKMHGDYVKEQHWVHIQCIDDYRKTAVKELNFCPDCKKPTAIRDEQQKINFSKFYKELISVEDCQELVQAFIESEYYFSSVLNMLFGVFAAPKLPEKNSCADLIIKDYIYRRLFEQSIQNLKNLAPYSLSQLATFATRYDDDSTFFLALTLFEEKISDRNRYDYKILLLASIQSFKIFEELMIIRKVNLSSAGRFRFYSRNFKPDRKVIERLNRERFFRSHRAKIKLLQEALDYDHFDDWFFWVKTINFYSIPLQNFRICLILATVKDFVPFFQWLHTTWSFNIKTAVAFYRLAWCSNSASVRIFLENKYNIAKGDPIGAEKDVFLKLVSLVREIGLIGTQQDIIPIDLIMALPKGLIPVSRPRFIKSCIEMLVNWTTQYT